MLRDEKVAAVLDIRVGYSLRVSSLSACVEFVSCFVRFVGSPGSAPSGIQYLSIFVHPLDSFRVLILREFLLSTVDS